MSTVSTSTKLLAKSVEKVHRINKYEAVGLRSRHEVEETLQSSSKAPRRGRLEARLEREDPGHLVVAVRCRVCRISAGAHIYHLIESSGRGR